MFSKKVDKILRASMNRVADLAGRPIAFMTAVVLLIGWFGVSRFMDYQTWFDIMDVAIFVTTFLMLFVVQASQNADTEAIQDKLDELIEALPSASENRKGEERKLKYGDQETQR